MDFGLTKEEKLLVERVDRLVKERIAPRAAHYDLALEAPREDIQELHREGWLLANLDRKRGGLGYGLYGDDPLAFFLLDEHLAYGNPSTAHCFQVHNNALMMIAQIGTEEQVAHWIQPTVERGALLTGCGAEPQGVTPSTATRVEGGFLVNGMKHYATNATLAEWFWIGSVGFEEQPRALMFMVHRDTPGLKIDAEMWQPTGMRACVSPWISLENCFVPEENLLGRPGQFHRESWLGKINFAFTANYLGSAQAIYDWGLAKEPARRFATSPLRRGANVQAGS
jgi:alkylation response protein AidB-like acyl-CoA dehydrogenase